MRFSANTKNQKLLIVLAAGLGKRMSGNIPRHPPLRPSQCGKTTLSLPLPKMLLPLCGRPLLYWSLKNVEECPAIDSILVTAPKNYREVFEKKIKDWRFRKVIAVIEGGKERQDSTLAALEHLPESAKWVGIHDAARVLVGTALVKKCFDSAQKTGAAILAVPSKDTIKISDGKKTVQNTIPRSRCWAAQTPQVFHRTLLLRMVKYLQTNSSRKALYTDDASIAEECGAKVILVPASYENIKITTPEDLILAEAILRERYSHV